MSQLSVFLRHAKRNNNKDLDLSKRQLSFIPKEVFSIRTIEILNLNSNKIATIEPSITDLFRLKQLYLENNSLVELPEELTSLPLLKVLALKGNPLNKKYQRLIVASIKENAAELLQDCFSHEKKQTKTPSWLIEPQYKKQEANESEIGWDKSIFKKEQPSIIKMSSQGRRTAQNGFKNIEIEKENESKNGVLEIKINDLEIGEQISMGGFSTIHKGSYFGLEVAIKKVFNPNISEELLKQFNNEIIILSKYRHPNIILMLGAVTTPPNLCIVMELMKEGTLYDIIHRKKINLADAEKRRIVKELISVFSYLHKHGIVHRDIKSHNVLLDKDYKVKLCDFGLAKHKSELNMGPMQFSGTPTYMAQQLFLKKSYNESVDIFALGTLFYEIYYGEVPYQGLDPADIKDKILKDSNLPSRVSVKKSITEIINRCRNSDPEERPTASDLSKFSDW